MDGGGRREVTPADHTRYRLRGVVRDSSEVIGYGTVAAEEDRVPDVLQRILGEVEAAFITRCVMATFSSFRRSHETGICIAVTF